MVLDDLVGHDPAGILPGQRIMPGTRKAPSQLVFFSLRNGVIAAVRPGVHVRAVVGRVDDDGVVGDAQLVERLEQLPTSLSWSIIVSW